MVRRLSNKVSYFCHCAEGITLAFDAKTGDAVFRCTVCGQRPRLQDSPPDPGYPSWTSDEC